MEYTEKILKINYSCNNNCFVCNFYTEIKGRVAYNNIEREIKNFGLEKGDCVNFIGPEPFIHSQIFKIFKLIPKNIKINVVTNGRLFYYKRVIENLKKFENLELFIKAYAHFPELHNAITCTEGSFQQMVKGLNQLPKKKFSIMFTISEQNFIFLNEMVKYYDSFLPNKIIIIPPLPFGKLYKNYFKFALRYTELVDVLKKKNHRVYAFLPFCFLANTKIKYVNLSSFLYFKKSENLICSKCNSFFECPGIPREYEELFGLDELESFI